MHLRLLSLVPSSILSLLLAWYLVPLAEANYWTITEPTTGVEWTNGQANLMSWSKGLMDGIDEFDIELQRLSVAGLSYIAHNVPSTMSSINVYIDNLPTADDYYVLFVNYTHGLLYTSSSTFTISDSTNSSSPSTNPGSPTVSITGAPNPTNQFATTFASSSLRGWTIEASTLQILTATSAVAMGLLGGALTVL